MSDLADMIDRVMASGDWRSIIISKHLASSLRQGDPSSAACSQLGSSELIGPRPSDHLRDLLEMHLKEGRWAWMRDEKVSPVLGLPLIDDYDDLGI